MTTASCERTRQGLLTGAEKTDLGILVFNVTFSSAAWIAENSELVRKFLKVTADANAMGANEANYS